MYNIIILSLIIEKWQIKPRVYSKNLKTGVKLHDFCSIQNAV